MDAGDIITLGGSDSPSGDPVPASDRSRSNPDPASALAALPAPREGMTDDDTRCLNVDGVGQRCVKKAGHDGHHDRREVRVRVKPDDQQNAGDGELSTLLPAGGSTAAIPSAASTDNGAGVTSAGGESGLPHHTIPAPMSDERLAIARKHSRRLVLELVAEIDRLRALAGDGALRDAAEALVASAFQGGHYTGVSSNALAKLRAALTPERPR
jgi:hypothetical protein